MLAFQPSLKRFCAILQVDLLPSFRMDLVLGTYILCVTCKKKNVCITILQRNGPILGESPLSTWKLHSGQNNETGWRTCLEWLA